MKVYASTTFLGNRPTRLAEVLAALGDVDLDGIELGSTHQWQPDITEQVAAHCSKPRLTHNYFPPAEHDMVLNIASADAEIRGRSIRHMKHCLAVAEEIGADLYTIHPGFLAEPVRPNSDLGIRAFDFKFRSDSTPYDRAFDLMTDALKDLLETAAGHGVRLAIETEGSLTSAGVTLMEQPAEYDRLFEIIPQGLHINLNLSHTSLAAKGHGFDMATFVSDIRNRIAAVEISHNDGHGDQHMPLEPGAPVLDWLPLLPDVPLILEFRCADADDIRRGVAILRDSDNTTKAARQ